MTDINWDQKAVDVIQNLSMLVRRLCHRLNKHEPQSKMVDQALGYLRGEGLQGSILRESNTASASHLELLLDRAQEQLQHNRHKHDDSRDGRDRCLKCRIRAVLAGAAPAPGETCPTCYSENRAMRNRVKLVPNNFNFITKPCTAECGDSWHSPAPAPQKEK